MHPFIARRRHLSIYAVAWFPLSVFLAYLLHASGHLTWTDAIALALPLCLMYQFMSLSAWYSCKSAPLDRADPYRLVLTHLTAAALVSFLWIEFGKIIALGLSRFAALSDLHSQYAIALPVVFAAGILLYLLAVAVFYIFLAVEANREAQVRVIQTTVLARDAELKALKAQVNPHFLFNSLNSISALTSVDPAKAREMCILLADFLRMTLGLGEKSSIPLGEELHLLEHFLAIEKVRFGARLEMREDIEEQTRSALIPALLLQPLLENAVTHGIANLLEGGTISLTARSTADRLMILIENTCDFEATTIRRGGLGLTNVRSRLDARYGKASDMRVTMEASSFKVLLTLPLEIASALVPSESVAEEQPSR
jgi:two-component system sensor histidine kinase AlgZ